MDIVIIDIRRQQLSALRREGVHVDSLSKVRREKSATGALQIGESVTVKTKSRA